MAPTVAADQVRVLVGVKEDLLKRHHKDRPRALEAWASLVQKRDALLADVAFGPVFTPPRLPASLRGIRPLRVVKGLPHAFRAVYTVFKDPHVGLVVQVEWVGDHKEYDARFGYATS